MLIDWFTVCAQIINFLILVWLLKRFLYGRIIRAIDARDRRIADALADAEARQTEAHEQVLRYEAKVRDFEEQRQSMLAEAKADAVRQHTQMLEEARRTVNELQSKWQQDLERDREAFLSALRRRAAAEALDIARRVIADMTSTDLESSAIEVFLQKIRGLDRHVWRRFASHDVMVRTALPISDDQRARILHAIEQQIGAPVRVVFESSQDIVLGLELCGDGWRVGWNANAYLEALEEDLNEALTEGNRASALAVQASK